MRLTSPSKGEIEIAIQGEYGFFSYDEQEPAERDFDSFCNIARNVSDLPCDFFLSVAEWQVRRVYSFVIAMILPAEFEQQASAWLMKHNINFGESVDGTRNVDDFYRNTEALRESVNFFGSVNYFV